LETLIVGALFPEFNVELKEYLVVGICDLGCPVCSGVQIFALEGAAKSAADVSLVCLNCRQVCELHDSSSSHQQSVEDRVMLLIESDGLYAASQRARISLKAITTGTSIAVVVSDSGVDDSVHETRSLAPEEAPDGFRTVAWIREYEAELIVSSYRSERSYFLRDDEGVVILETRFHTAHSPESVRYKAQVLAIRHRKKGSKNIGWIRLEEARAVLESSADMKTINFFHTSFGRGGRVEFFPADSEIALKYRSQTRLLRRNA